MNKTKQIFQNFKYVEVLCLNALKREVHFTQKTNTCKKSSEQN